MAARVYIGASSWVDKALVASKRFYPPDAADTASRLAFYAERFNLAEVDSTYYALPSKRNTQRWADAVPEDFRFSVKAFALFTQHPTRLSSIPKSFHDELPPEVRKKARVYYKDVPPELSEKLWGIFLGALEPMREAGKLGAILLDFPPWFGPSEANRAYLEHARERLGDENVMVEFRNRRWVEDETSAASTFDLRRELGYGFVCVDEPPGLKSSFPPVVALTSSIGAIRFRGRNGERWEEKGVSTEERLNWWYSDEELSEWLPGVRQLAAEAEEVYLAFNTKAEDQSVVNAARLQRLLEQEG